MPEKLTPEEVAMLIRARKLLKEKGLAADTENMKSSRKTTMTCGGKTEVERLPGRSTRWMRCWPKKKHYGQGQILAY
jgi:hypothetical protein